MGHVKIVVSFEHLLERPILEIKETLVNNQHQKFTFAIEAKFLAKYVFLGELPKTHAAEAGSRPTRSAFGEFGPVFSGVRNTKSYSSIRAGRFPCLKMFSQRSLLSIFLVGLPEKPPASHFDDLNHL
jgi:hypothetical protein